MSYTPQNAPREAPGRISVIVKLRETAPLVAAVAPGGGQGGGGRRDAEPLWDGVRQRYPGVTIERGLQGINPELLERAQRDAGGPERLGADLNNFYRLRLPPGTRSGDVVDFVQTGNNRQLVQTAYVDAGAIPARIDPTNDPLFPKQTYIRGRRGNKRGIYANFAWAKPGGDGTGIGIVFVEMAWLLTHEDFAGSGISLISGVNGSSAGNREHGTNTVGEVSGQDNDKGIVGVAPKARVRVISTERTAGNHDTASAIMAGVLAMSAGDVMSISLQTAADPANPWPATGFRPLEIRDMDRAVIRLGTLLGRVICTAAGNGNLDLDTATDAAGKFVLRRGHADFKESGAIMVGAGTDMRPHDKVPASNFGSRIDCFAQGVNVTTTSAGAAKYVDDFRNTSAATPIVAGAAVLLQGMVKARIGSVLSVAQVKSVLAGTKTSIPSRNPTIDRIGRMPNMQLICQYYVETLKVPTPVRTKELSPDEQTLFVDPGHGGDTSAGQSTAYGGSGTMGVHEKDVALQIAQRVRAHYGGACVLSRDGDYNVSLERRALDARRSGARTFVSLHAHSGRTRNAGPEVWVYGNGGGAPDPHSMALAEHISDDIASSYGRAVPVREGRLTVLDPRLHRSGVAACLVEAGSLADPIDERRLADPYSTDLIGAAVARGVQRYMGTFGLESDEIDAEDTLYETPARGHALEDSSHEPDYGIQEVGQSYTDYAQAYSDDAANDGSSGHADYDAYGDPTPVATTPFPNILQKRPDLYPAALAADAALKKLAWFKDVYVPLMAATGNARLALNSSDEIVVISEQKSVEGLLGPKVVKDVLKRAGKTLVSELVGRDFARVLSIADFLLKLKTALELEPSRRLVSEQNHSKFEEAYRYKLRYFIRLRNASVSPGDDPTNIDYRVEQAFWAYRKAQGDVWKYEEIEENLSLNLPPDRPQPPRMNPA